MTELRLREPLIFELSKPGRRAPSQFPPLSAPHVTSAAGASATGTSAARSADEDGLPVPAHLRRETPLLLPQVSELQAVRHYTRLSQLNFSIDTHFYPLGSCTMKYNPKACNTYAMLPEFVWRATRSRPSPRAFSPACSNCRRCSRTSPACRA